MPNCTEQRPVQAQALADLLDLLGVAASPAIIAAGSPGVSRSIRNTSTATTNSTGIVASTRRTRNGHQRTAPVDLTPIVTRAVTAS